MQTTLLFILSLIFALSNADLQLQLSVGRINIAAAAVGTKALFAGGLLAPEIEGGLEIATDLVDIYDVSTGLWAQANLSAPGSSLLALSVGAKVLFCGGLNGTNIVDIYDDESGEWTTHELNENREFIKGTVVGTKAIIGGGRSLVGGILGISDIVEIYDSETGLWTTSLPLLTARISAAVTNVANWALFIGGLDAEGNILGDIDIYDVDANAWTSTNLSVVRTDLSAVSVGGLYAVIAGGLTLDDTLSDACEIFNGVNWTLSVLPEARSQMAAATDGIRAYFIGGISDLVSLAASARVDIYDPETDTWTLKALVEARLNVAAINVGLRVFVAGGGNYSDACEVFEPEMETPTPVDTPTPVVETPTPVIVPTPTPGATPTPTPTPGATPTPTPTPTPSPTVGPIQCRLDCLTDFDNGKEGIVERTHFTDRCKVWTDYRDCLANCEDSTVEQEAQRAVCNIEPYIGELCDCSGDGGGQPISIRLALILADFEDIFLSYFNEINGCQDAAWPEALATLLRFTFRYENTATNMDQIAIDLKALLGLYLNQNPERFVFGNNKREIVDGALTVEVVEPPPPAGSAAGVTVSFAFFLVIALFHMF